MPLVSFNFNEVDPGDDPDENANGSGGSVPKETEDPDPGEDATTEQTAAPEDGGTSPETEGQPETVVNGEPPEDETGEPVVEEPAEEQETGAPVEGIEGTEQQEVEETEVVEEEEDDTGPECPKLCEYMAVDGKQCLSEIHSQEPWPQDVKLFQPYEVEQILLPDNANCLAVQAFLKMCGLDFEVEPRSNAEYMSPSGRVPFIKCGAFVVAELDPIISFVSTKGISLSEQLDSSQKADMRAYMSLVHTVLANAELYVTWCDKATLQEVTKPRFGSVLPWPLNHVIAWQKRGQVVKKLGVLGWANKSIDEVYQEVENCCSALSERLANRPFFFGDRPTELDALLYGHLFALLTAPLPIPANKVASTVRQHKDLIDFVKQIDQKFFNRSTSISKENLPAAAAEEPPPSQGPAASEDENIEAEEGPGETEVEPTPDEGEPLAAPEEGEPPAAAEEGEPPAAPEEGEPPAAPEEGEQEPADGNEDGEEAIPEAPTEGEESTPEENG